MRKKGPSICQKRSTICQTRPSVRQKRPTMCQKETKETTSKPFDVTDLEYKSVFQCIDDEQSLFVTIVANKLAPGSTEQHGGGERARLGSQEASTTPLVSTHIPRICIYVYTCVCIYIYPIPLSFHIASVVRSSFDSSGIQVRSNKRPRKEAYYVSKETHI
jgi:hypothetical protein